MLVGSLGSKHRAHVRAGGRVVLHEGTASELRLDWWIGGDDRWYEPDREITSRESLVRDVPIVSVATRVPSGDAVVTSFTTVQGPRELVVTELSNKSKVPFACALIMSGPGSADVTLRDAAICVGGLPLVHLPSAPRKSACAADVDALRTVVQSGSATDRYEPIVGPSASAFIFALTHSLSIRAAAVVGASSPAALAAAPVMSALPSVHDLASGWDVHLARGAAIPSLPGDGGAVSTKALISSSLLAAEPVAADPSSAIIVRATLARALDCVGFHAEAGALLEDAPQWQGSRGSLSDRESLAMVGSDDAVTATVIDALGLHALFAHDAVFAQTMSPVVAGGLEYLIKRSKKDDLAKRWLGCGSSVIDMFRVARDESASAQVERLLRKLDVGPLPSLPLPPVAAMNAGGGLVPEQPIRLAEMMRQRVAALVGFERGGVVVLSGLRGNNLGLPLDVRNVPTPFGRLSLAVRWHGERPALLWECVAVHDDQQPSTLVLRAPAFGGWTDRGASGETLLPEPSPEP